MDVSAAEGREIESTLLSSGQKRSAAQAGLPPVQAAAQASAEAAGASASEDAGDGSALTGKKARLTPGELALLPYRSRICNAARTADLSTALAAYEEMLSKAVRPSTYIYNVILSICTRTAEPIDAGLLQRAVRLFDAMGSQGVPVNESAYTSLIRVCAVAGDRGQGESFLRRMIGAGIPPRLRSYSPLLQTAAAAGDAAGTVSLFEEMTSVHGIEPTQVEHAALLRAYAFAGDHARFIGVLEALSGAGGEKEVSPPLANLLQHYFRGQLTPGVRGVNGVDGPLAAAALTVQPGIMTQAPSTVAAAAALAAAYAGDAAAASAAAAAAGAGTGAGLTRASLEGGQHRSFAARSGESALSSGCHTAGSSSSSSGTVSIDDAFDMAVAALEAQAGVAAAGSVPPSSATASSTGATAAHPADWPWECSVVAIDPRHPVCPRTARRLRSVQLPPPDHAALLSQVDSLASKVGAPWASFKGWVARHGPFDVVVDGANVGFANQNFGDGALMYSQINAVVRAFERQGKRVLLVLARRWLDGARLSDPELRRPKNARFRKLLSQGLKPWEVTAHLERERAEREGKAAHAASKWRKGGAGAAVAGGEVEDARPRASDAAAADLAAPATSSAPAEADSCEVLPAAKAQPPPKPVPRPGPPPPAPSSTAMAGFYGETQTLADVMAQELAAADADSAGAGGKPAGDTASKASSSGGEPSARAAAVAAAVAPVRSWRSGGPGQDALDDSNEGGSGEWEDGDEDEDGAYEDDEEAEGADAAEPAPRSRGTGGAVTAVRSGYESSSDTGSSDLEAEEDFAGGGPSARTAEQLAEAGWVAPDAKADGRIAAAIARRWAASNVCYQTPPGANDDWYWMYAALSHPAPERVVCISNDQMRDHHYQMLQTRTFPEWRERHQVTYRFQGDGAGGQVPAFTFPRTYSHRLQRSEDGNAWFAPIEGTGTHWVVGWRKDGGVLPAGATANRSDTAAAEVTLTEGAAASATQP
jgi:pentatricopeptide repeat protein